MTKGEISCLIFASCFSWLRMPVVLIVIIIWFQGIKENKPNFKRSPILRQPLNSHRI